MSITFAGGNIVISIESTVGTVHTTNIHLVPLWLVLAALGAVILPIWLARRKRLAGN
jgi:hypothetical protein